MSEKDPMAARRRLSARLVRSAHERMFKGVHENRLIYNACWEDPRIDRALLRLDADSRVVTITSAGCNALDYLLDGPAELHAVDVNFRQNAVLDLKRALIRHAAFADFFELFGIGSHERYRELYAEVRGALGAEARRFWDANITFFNPRSVRKSFYYQGAAGAAAWVIGHALFRAKPNIKNYMLCLLDAESLAEQEELYSLLEAKIWGRLNTWLIRQPALMTLLGVPGPQIKLIEHGHSGGLTRYIKEKLRHVATAIPIRDNYFWRVYATGSYTPHCCPEYLRKENQPALRSRLDRIRIHTCTISEFLRLNPGTYTHYVLLDHQDWLAWRQPAALREEWSRLFANSRPGTKILMRSAARDVGFIPADIRARLRFFPRRTVPLHRTDRVGTYGSLHLAEVL